MKRKTWGKDLSYEALVASQDRLYRTKSVILPNRIAGNSWELCLSLSVRSIEEALRKLVASGKLKRKGLGKRSRYYRLK